MAQFKESEHPRDKDGKFTYKGNKMFVMHNHPRNSSFSIDDLTFLFGNKDIKTMSIVKNNGEIEILTKLPKINDKLAFAIQQRYMDEFLSKNATAEKTSEKTMKKLERLGYIKWIK